MRKWRRVAWPGLAATAAVAVVGLAVPGRVLGGTGSGGGRAATGPGPDVQARVDAVTAAGAPGAVARYEEAGHRWTRTSGVAELGRPSPLSPQARFRVGSMTKSFVAAVVLQLVEEGRLELDAPVGARLPGLLPYEETITVRQLLGHTSGLPDYAADPAILEQARQHRVFAPAELVAIATDEPLQFAPGSRFAYSNTNYIVAGMLVERVTGQSIGAELERRILGPLGLGHTSFPATTADIDGVHARGYVMPGPGEPLIDVTAINPSHAWAAGALVSTVADVARFFEALLGGAVVSPQMLEAMRTTSSNPGDESTRYGLGLMAVETPCGAFWGNFGEIWGYHAWSFRSEDGGRALTEMTNLMPRPPEVNHALGEVHALLCDPGTGG